MSSISKKKKSFDLARKCDTLLNENKLDSAQILLDEAIKLYRGNYIAYNDRAFLKIKQGRPSNEIINDYQKAISLWPNYDIAIYSLATYYFSIKDFKNTIDASSKYLNLLSTKALQNDRIEDVYYMKGVSEKHLMLFNDAINDLKNAIRINSTNKLSHEELGECYYYGRNDITKAISEYTNSLQLDTTFYNAYYEREICYRNSTPPLLEKAKSDSENVSKYDTTHPLPPDSIYLKLRKFRLSLNAQNLKASAFYDSIIALYKPDKIFLKEVVDNVYNALLTVYFDSTANIDLKYLQSITDDAIANTKISIMKINEIHEVDTVINLKKKTLDYENTFNAFMINNVPEILKTISSKKRNQIYKLREIIMPVILDIKKKGKIFLDAQHMLFDKYSLH